MEIYLFDANFAEKVALNILNKYKKKDIKEPTKQKIHSFAYFVLDKILAKYYQIFESEIDFINKKPYVKNREKCVSISHSDKYVVLAVSDYNCGIDIEVIKERNYQKVSKRMNFFCDSLINFYENWTQYEAKYKLNSIINSQKTFCYEKFVITAVSENVSEKFKIIVPNLDDFSNLIN